MFANPNLWIFLKYKIIQYSSDKDAVKNITEEQWETLRERGILKGGPGYKRFCLNCCKYLAQMTDEEHQNAVKRGLYRKMDIDEIFDYGGTMDGMNIWQLSKLDDDTWQTVMDRDLLHAHTKYGKVNTWMSLNETKYLIISVLKYTTLKLTAKYQCQDILH